MFNIKGKKLGRDGTVTQPIPCLECVGIWMNELWSKFLIDDL